MQRKTQRQRPYFAVGNKVQLKPEERLLGNALKGLHGTIRRIKQLPDPQFFPIETQEDWEEFLRSRSVRFWIKLDDFPELNDYYKQNEVVFRYRELRPLQPRMGKQQLAQYCKERFLKEQNKHRRDAYLGAMRYLNGEWPGWPLSSLDSLVPKGYSVDLINCFINGATKIRKLAQESLERDEANEIAEIFEVQAQVCDEIYQQLMPKRRVFAHLA
jgi:hypothetical protein